MKGGLHLPAQSALKTVVVCYDENEFAEMLKLDLEKGGYGMVTATNGKRGVAQAWKRSGLILIDRVTGEVER